MPTAAAAFGIALIALGLGGYFGTGRVSATALIPACFGVPLLVLGWAARNSTPTVRRHTMHLAALLGMLGLIGSGVRAFSKLGKLLSGQAEHPSAVILQLIMAVLCVVFVGLCVRSFVAARRVRDPDR